MPEWPRIRQVPARSAWDRLRGSRQWRPQLCRSEAPTADLRWPDRRQNQRPAAQVAPPPPSPLHRGRSLRRYDISILQAEFSLTQVLDRPICDLAVEDQLNLLRASKIEVLTDYVLDAGVFVIDVQGRSDVLRSGRGPRSNRLVVRTMASCNGVPTRWAINPIKTAGCAVKRSCNGVPATSAVSIAQSTACGVK